MSGEIWKPLIVKDQVTGYTISSFGSIRDENEKLCKFYKKDGRYTFCFRKDEKTNLPSVHRLVAQHFLDNPDELKYVQHIDGNQFNNRVDNLKWISSIRGCIPNKVRNKELIEESLNDPNWRPIYIDGEMVNYSVSIYGQVRVADTVELRVLDTLDGYASCQLHVKGKHYSKKVHRLVAEAFIPNDDEEKKYINHINHNKLDNRVENLEWITASENIKHAHQKADRKSTRKPIIRRDLDGTNEVRYEYVNQAKSVFGNYIQDCLAGRRPHAYGYIWTYVNECEKVDIDLNEFKPIENHPEYLISRDGRVYSCFSEKLLAPGIRGMYLSVFLKTEHCNIHRLVALNFIDKPDHYDDTTILVVNHKDGDKLNNHVENLEWVSYSENVLHIINKGCHKSAKPVVQKDLEGNVVQEHPSISHTSRSLDLGRSVHCHIVTACENKCIKFGCLWEFKVV